MQSTEHALADEPAERRNPASPGAALRTGSGLAESARIVNAAHHAATQPALVVQTFADFEAGAATEPDHLIDGLIEDRAWAVWAGEPRSFKSMAALNAAIALSTGKPVLGFAPRRTGRTLYVCEEGRKKAVADRIRTMATAYETKHPDIHIAWKQAVTLNDPISWQTVLDAVAKLKPDLVILDTFSRVFSGSENDSKDVRVATAALDHLVENYDCAAIVIHHTNKAGSGTAGYKLRGSGSLPAAAQSTAIFTTEVDPGGLKTAKGRIALESKDSEPQLIHFQFDGPNTYLLTTRTDLERPTPERLADLATRLSERGIRTSSTALKDAWEAKHDTPFGRSRWAELVRQAVLTGALDRFESGHNTHYLPSATHQISAILEGSE